MFAQEDPYYDGSLGNRYNPMYRPGGFGNLYMPTSFDPAKKTDVNVQLGTSFSTNFNGGHAFSTMVAPELRYKVNERFSIRGGVSISNTDYGNTLVLSPNGLRSYSGNVTQGFIYVSGDYMISPKVILSGTAYKEFSVDHSNPDNAFRPGYDGKGLIMNLRLFPTDNMQIDVGAEFYQGNNPWRGGTYNPFYGPFSRPGW
jgi:hypothetical protein